MEIYDRSVIEKLYHACIADNIDLEIGIYLRNGDFWEYIPPVRPLYGNRDYKAVFKLSNIGGEIDFKDVQLRVKKMEDTLPLRLYRELGQDPVERVDFTDINVLKSPDTDGRTPVEAYRIVYFRLQRQITADERHELFRCGVYATIIPRGHHWHWADQEEFAALSLDVPSMLNFGDVSFARTVTKTLKLDSAGEGDLTITEVVVGGGSDFGIPDGLSLPYTLPSGQTVPLGVEFSPSDLGLKQDTLTIHLTDPANPIVTVSLIGRGVHSFSVKPQSINFSEVMVSQTEARHLRLQNDGQEDVEVTDIQVSGRYFSCDVSSLTVIAGSFADLDISFTPLRDGSWTGKMTAVSSYAPNPGIAVILVGSGTHWLTANPETVDFGRVRLNQLRSRQIEIKNTGPSACSLSSIKILTALGAAVEFSIGPLHDELPFSLEPGDRVNLGVLAKPTGKGEQKGSLEISYATNGIRRESLNIELKVTGT